MARRSRLTPCRARDNVSFAVRIREGVTSGEAMPVARLAVSQPRRVLRGHEDERAAVKQVRGCWEQPLSNAEALTGKPDGWRLRHDHK